MREIEDPPTWTFCFLALIAFSVEKKATCKDLAAYTQLIIHLSQRHGGRGWLAYKLGHNQEERENKTCVTCIKTHQARPLMFYIPLVIIILLDQDYYKIITRLFILILSYNITCAVCGLRE